MALKAVLTTLDGVDEAHKALYTKKDDGKYHLDVEGMVLREKLDEFRGNNTKLMEEVKALKESMSKFEGVDLEKYNELLKHFESDAERKLIKDGKIDEVIQMRTEKMRQDFANQLKAKDAAIAQAQASADKATGERNSYIVEQELRKGVDNKDYGFKPGTADLLIDKVMKEFVYKDGKVIRMKNGEPVYGAKGEHATMSEFLQEITQSHPHLVEASTGGGANNGGGGGGAAKGKIKRSEWAQMTDHAQKAKMAREGMVVD